MSRKVVIIGAVALGPKAGCRFKRLEPESQVVMVDQESLISYGGCGIPYYISGDVPDASELQSTSFHMLRDEKFFKEAKEIEVMTQTRALSINRQEKRVLLERVDSGEKTTLPYDKLVIATGSIPKRLPIPGSDLDGVFTIANMNAAIAIKERIASGQVEKALVIGGGFIGLEMAEALTDMWGIDTTVIEITEQILPGLISSNMARMVQKHMEENEVSFHLQERVTALEGRGKVQRAITDKRVIDCDLVIIAVGAEPNSELARDAGLEISPRGAIVVNSRMQTSDPDIYAGGDCVEVINLITGKPGYYPLGSMANRQGRVIGTNLAGGVAEFPGAVGSFVVKIFDMSVAAAGLTLAAARKEGFDAASALVCQFDRAHFYPEKDLMFLELVVEKHSGRVLGIQGLGNKGDGTVGRINAVAAILRYQPTTADISNLEIAYSPPFSAAMDILNALGNTAENILAGKNRVLEVDEFAQLWQSRSNGKAVFLDCRGWGNAEPFVKKYPQYWQSIPQDELKKRLAEVPRDKKLVLICNTGVRSYEAQVMLDQEGIRDTANLQGGVACLKKWGLDLLKE
ncbi:MAG: FAD-dependent oxidoreductase [Deltaproteobacteria bacterium]|nr:FAD-dependent oxidoreductase [Deltaproteobacteria bacterium]MBW2071946.1 FAD-dependent oxidoreductase [Deltaproteobacteria bacterium]